MRGRFWGEYMGRTVDRWHKSRPGKDEPECGEHKGKVASTVHGVGLRWQARYDGPDGRERTKLFKTQAEADRYITENEHAKLTGSWVDPSRGRMKIRQAVTDLWLPAASVSSQSLVEYQGVMNRYVIPEWGHREIQSIRPSEAAAWQQLLVTKYKLAPSTAHGVARHARSLFRLAVLDRLITVSPFAGVPAPKRESKEVQPPDIDEVRQMVEHAYKDVWRTLVEVASQTGLRLGELRGLRVDDVDFLRLELTVRQQVVEEPKKPIRLGKLKTPNAYRTLPITRGLAEVLAAYLKKYPTLPDGEFAGLVFHRKGLPVKETSAAWALERICQLAGAPRRHWHELRHHYASVLIAGGENPRAVQRRMGHKNVQLTLQVYSHLFDEAEDKTRRVLEEAWGVPEGFPASGGTSAESVARVVPLSKVSS